MNTGLGDAYDIAWKLAMVLKGAGGENLLQSYEAERRPVAIKNVQRAAEHMGVHQHYVAKTLGAGPEVTLGNSTEGKAIKAYVKEYVDANDGENKDFGIEMDYRLSASPIIARETGLTEPKWLLQAYAPSTAPGSRSPHMFLADGTTSIYDIFGKEYTVVEFSKAGSVSLLLQELAKAQGLPLSRVHLPNEVDARRIWARDVVIVRPDHFVAWRSIPHSSYDAAQLSEVLAQVFGRISKDLSPAHCARHNVNNGTVAFEGVERTFDQDVESVEKLGVFQR
jgi:FAD-dependent monooxygenase